MDERVLGERVLSWAVERRARIVSDGDWDGIVASALLVRELRGRGYEPEVEFPPPRRLAGMEVGRAVLVELAPTRGYRVVDDSLLIDHHGFVGVKLLRPGGVEEVWGVLGGVESVAELVARLLGFRPVGEWARLLEAVNLIDVGRSGDDELALALHRAYLYHVSEGEMRRMLLGLLVEGRVGEVFEWARREAERYVEALGRVEDIVSRVVEVGGCAVSWYVLGGDEEKVFREAMFRLEEKYRCCVMLGVRDGLVERMHVGTYRGDVDAARVAEAIVGELRRVGVEATGGGRRGAAGVQVLGRVSLGVALDAVRRALAVMGGG